ncbi:ATP-dependent helicase [Canibacter zhoujuaniae]|uniref:ATP-dependent helicase n=1 Tax=Canibacter zhoujuaniae TaxID=2708343 RepID=UPI001423AE21|nr:UvrD-helicase domain-containing protein [Canibacter zhoujuaniae]
MTDFTIPEDSGALNLWGERVGTTASASDSGWEQFLGNGESLTAGLNEQQRRAVESRSRALLVVAGAGSGKTKVLTHRIAHLVRQHDAWPSQILAITFTNKAAAEMKERLAALLGKEAERMWISTFHSACVRILRKEAERFGYNSGFTIYDTGDTRALMKSLIKQHAADVFGFKPASVLSRISKAKCELRDASDVAREADMSNPREAMFVQLFTDYEASLRRARAMDFDDLLAQTVHLFRAFPDVAARYQRRFRWILVDEYQDTNRAQYALISELTKPIRRENQDHLQPPVRVAELNELGEIPSAALTVVGDSDQSIYSFRGADIRNIQDFEQDFPDAEVVVLEQNYRSTQNILSAANAVISHNFDRQDKKLWSDLGDGEKIQGFAGYSPRDEARFVSDEIETLANRGRAYGDLAILYRTNTQSRVLEEALVRSAIPYRVFGGTKFYDRSEVKDVLAYLHCVVNPYDPIAWSRMLSSPKRGVGPAAEAAIAMFQEQNDISFHEAMLRAAEIPGITGQKLKTVRALGEMFAAASEMAFGNAEKELQPKGAGAIVEYLMKETQYVEKLKAKPDPQEHARAENVEEFMLHANEFDAENTEATLIDFLTEVALVSDGGQSEDGSGEVSLMTLHSAKGLEFPTVFFVGFEEGLLPHATSVEEPGGISEERRLTYVGITRAKEQLYITLAATRDTYTGETHPTAESRFLNDIPEDLIVWRQHIDEVSGATGFRGGWSSAVATSSGEGWGGSENSNYGWGSGRSSENVWSGDADSSLGYSRRLSQKSAGQRRGRVRGDNSATAKWEERKREARQGLSKGQGFTNIIDPSKAAAAGVNLAVGDSVEHDMYGVGEVFKLAGTGAKQVAFVRFPEVGEKKLLVSLAPMRKLDQ